MFSKKPAEAPRTTAPASSSMSGKNSTFSILGRDVAIKGDISASADLHIDGRIEGDIQCAALVQGEESEIVGTIKAESARLSGRLRGSIGARELVVLKSARIEGDVNYESLTIEQGAVVEGHFGQLGAKPSAIPASTGSEDKEMHLKLADQA